MTNETSRARESISRFEAQFAGAVGASGGGSKSISPIVTTFFDTCNRVVSCINPQEWQVIRNVVSIAEAGLYAGLNTFPEQDVSEADYKCIKQIFVELENLLDETLINARPLTVRIVDGKIEHSSMEGQSVNLEEKIACISKILYCNQAKARCMRSIASRTVPRCDVILWKYEELWHVIGYMIEKWNDLKKRGYSAEVYGAYVESCEFGKSGSKTFMSLLEGRSKLIPVYRYTMVGYTTVDTEASDVARIEHDTHNAKIQIFSLDQID